MKIHRKREEWLAAHSNTWVVFECLSECGIPADKMTRDPQEVTCKRCQKKEGSYETVRA